MSNNSFIDGLKPRSEKKALTSSIKQKSFSSGYFSYESGDPLASHSRKRNIGAATEAVVFGEKKATKKLETVNISKKIENVAKEEKESYFEKKNVKTMAATGQRSYERDVLGIEEDDEIIEFDSDDIKKEKKKTKKHKKKFIFRHKILSFIVIPLLIVGLVAYFWGDSIVMKITGGQSGLLDLVRSIVIPGDQRFKTDSNGRTNILVFGTSGYDMKGSEGKGTHSGSQLTDSIMVVSIDQNTRDVAMFSLPRDLKTDTCTNTSKINELYYCNSKKGNEKAGADALRNRVSSMVGLDIQYYVHINWMSLIQIVDALGGITVTLNENIHDDMTKTYIKAGVPTKLNGERALGLARARHGTDYGDFTRGNSQQKILVAMKEKLSSQQISIGWLINMFNILGDNIRTDFTADDISAAAKFVAENGIESIRPVQLYGSQRRLFTTGRINGISYTFPAAGQTNYSAIQRLVKSQLNADPMKAENAKILVLNASGVEGAATKEKEELTGAGFTSVSTGNAPAGDYFEKLYVYVVNDKTATREKLETYYGVKTLDQSMLPSGVNTKNVDFVVILGVGYSD
jgi:LCP family protein required for cell wall assembly